MPKRPKNHFKNYGGAKSPCWFCEAPTTYALLDVKDGSEVWCCVKCLWKKGKVKRFKKKSKKSSNLRVKLDKKDVSGEGLNDE